MAKTLVLIGTDFSTNKIETVTFNDPIPCTGISLDKATLALTSVGQTGSITATVSPSNTTDSVVWSSSDNTVASVTAGTVTAVGIGTATITATCGSYSATCTIAVTVFVTGAEIYPDAYMSASTLYESGTGVIEIASASTSRGAILATSGVAPIAGHIHDTAYYPILIPANANQIKVTYSKDAIRIQCLFFCSQYPASGGSYARCVDKIIRENITVANNQSLITIPQHDGLPAVDCIAIMLQNTSYETFLETDFDTISFEFLHGTVS